MREHFASPLLQFADVDKDETFVLVEHPGKFPGVIIRTIITSYIIIFSGGTGSLIAALENDQIDIAM